jgi:hypothetical protein
MNQFKFKKCAKQEIGTEDVWYALTDGGYLKPQYVIQDKKQLEDWRLQLAAIALVQAFFQQCYDGGVIEEA